MAVAGSGGIGLGDVAFVLAAVVGILLSLDTTDKVRLEFAFSEPIDPAGYANGHAPRPDERIPPPVIADVDGDGLPEVVLAGFGPTRYRIRSASLAAAPKTSKRSNWSRDETVPVSTSSKYDSPKEKPP